MLCGEKSADEAVAKNKRCGYGIFAEILFCLFVGALICQKGVNLLRERKVFDYKAEQFEAIVKQDPPAGQFPVSLCVRSDRLKKIAAERCTDINKVILFSVDCSQIIAELLKTGANRDGAAVTYFTLFFSARFISSAACSKFAAVGMSLRI